MVIQAASQETKMSIASSLSAFFRSIGQRFRPKPQNPTNFPFEGPTISADKIVASAISAPKISVAALSSHTAEIGILSEETTRQTWERFDAIGAATAVRAKLLTQQQSDDYLMDCKARYERIFDASGELRGPHERHTVARPILKYAQATVTPGRIVIAGDTKLEDWRSLPDTTAIHGGSITSGTVTVGSHSAIRVFTTKRGKFFTEAEIVSALEGRSVRAAGKLLDVNYSTLHGWKKKIGQ
jgi:hypothetical protein